MNLQFGTGQLFAFNTQVGAIGMAGSPPVQFGGLQDVELDFSFTNKDLYGQSQFPIAVARGLGKVTGKAKFADMSSLIMNELFWGQTLAAGQNFVSANEGPTAIPTTPFQITVVKGATWVTDYGVRNAATGVAMIKVLSGTPVAGQYKCTTGGVYTFSSADNISGISVLISYAYTTAATGYTLAINNQLQGYAPVFQAALQGVFNNQVMAVQLYQCVSTKITIPTKMEDFMIQDFEFSCFVNAAGQLMTISFPQ